MKLALVVGLRLVSIDFFVGREAGKLLLHIT